ncbi:trigger factor, partial [Pelagibacteraceae bacterium]|nr:trigger factor [Pelagibacteraceae bacterium]
EVQKQIKGMPGQEKMVLDYYQKNPSAAQSLKGALYEEKILSLFKSKINLKKKKISIPEAEKIISDFNKETKETSPHAHKQESGTKDNKESKTNKSSSNIKKTTKKVSKK